MAAYCIAPYDAETGAPFHEEVFESYHFPAEDHGSDAAAKAAAEAEHADLIAAYGTDFVEWRLLRFG